MSALNDEIRRATSAASINEGLSSWFSRTASESLDDAEHRWLKEQLAVAAVDFTSYADQAAAVTDGWVLGTGWTFDAANDEFDKAAGTGSNLSRPMGDIVGASYNVTVVIANQTAGQLTVSLGGHVSAAIVANGTYTFKLTPSDANSLVLTADASFDGSLGSVGITVAGANNDLWYAFLRDATYTGSVNDMKLAYWKAQP